VTISPQTNSKAANYMAILALIRSEGPLSRANLAQRTGLSVPTVSTITDDLQKVHLIEDLGQGGSRGGRRPQLYGFNAKVRQIVALSLSKRKLTTALLDMNGNIVTRREQSIQVMNEPDKGLKEIVTAVENLMASEKISQRGMAYIGLSVPGVVSSDGDLVISSPLQWYDIPLGQYLRDHFQLPVLVENDGIAAVWAEREMGAGQGGNHIVAFLGQDTGIGSGIILNGQIYRGVSGVAGEIGHMVVEENGPRCTCGNYGCLQVTAVPDVLVLQARAAIEDGVDTHMARMIHGDLNALTLETVVEALNQGDRVAFNLVDRVGIYMGSAIAKVVHILNPSKVIIGGGFAPFGEILLEPVRRAIKASVLSRASNALEVTMSTLGQDVSLRGVALLCSEQWLSSFNIESELL
jgi:glucokinase-like ROK family protein